MFTSFQSISAENEVTVQQGIQADGLRPPLNLGVRRAPMLLNPPKIQHLEPSSLSKGSIDFTVAPDACADDFIALLAWLPRGFELGFYDQYYPSMSDPGAYVGVQRKDSAYIYKLGNHGWSSDWSQQSPELLAAWMMLNMTKKHPFSQNLSVLSVREAYHDPWQRA